MKFVRWLGAFGGSSSLYDAGLFEISNKKRQVAVEPLVRGRSLIRHARIDLAVDHEKSQFVHGFVHDAWTNVDSYVGILINTREKRIKSLDRLLAVISKKKLTGHHGEAVFDLPVFCGVVFDASNTPKKHKKRVRQMAADLANNLDLDLVSI